MNNKHAFESLKILDFTSEMGSYCSKLFADMGAEVLKVEPPNGDTTRLKRPFFQCQENEHTSIPFSFLNTNKRSISLNLETTIGQEIIKKLVKEYDVIIEDFGPSYMDLIGMGYKHIKQINPSVIFTSISSFGHDGPYSHYLATDLIGLAMGGLLNISGYPDVPPYRPYGNQAYFAVSLNGAVGTLLAIIHREFTGEGQQVDVSMQESVSIALENAIQLYDLEGKIRSRSGMEQEAGSGIYPCKDGFVYLMVAGLSGSSSWENFLQWLTEEGVKGIEQLYEEKWLDRKWRSSDRGKAEFRDVFNSFSLCKNKITLYEEGQKRQIVICPINDMHDVISNPQLHARNFFISLYHHDLRQSILYPGAPYHLSETPWSLRSPAPDKGKDNIDIYTKLGFTVEDVNRLQKEGIF